jgi:hypothetical protein
MTPKQLKKYYTRCNELYFANELPKDVEVRFDVSVATKDEAQVDTMQREDGSTYEQILLSPEIKILTRYTKWSILHEMAHMSVSPYDGHGAKFQDEMIRLAMRGAFAKIW